MRHVWGFASAIGLLVFVVFGTLGCLTAQVEDRTAAQSLLIALGGAVLMVVGVVARGSGPSSLAKVRQVVGSLGLVLTPIAAVLAFLALATGSSSAPTYLILLVLGMFAWAQGSAAQSGLGSRASLVWLSALVLVIAAGVVSALLLSGFLVGLGLSSRSATAVSGGITLSVIGLLVATWRRGRPDRQAVPGALARMAVGRATPVDRELLAAGPGPILRRRSGKDPGQPRVDAALAAADARLADAAGSPAPIDPDETSGKVGG